MVGGAGGGELSAAPSYFERVGAHFSGEVGLIDELDRSNRIHAYVRRESIATLRRVLPEHGKLLEFGYGTGTEAIALANAGATVVGLDPSDAMRERATQKAIAAGVEGRCDFRLGSTADARALSAEFAGAPFDGAFATLGPLNCEPDLYRFSGELSRLLKPGAPLVALVINRHCPWEVVLQMAGGDFRRAFRRYSHDWGTLGTRGDTGAAVEVWSYSPRSFAGAMAPAFQLEEYFGLCVALPPPYAYRDSPRLANLWPLLESADLRLRHRFPFRVLGDHFEAILRSRRG